MQTLLKKATSLERIVSLIGQSELSAEDQIAYKRAQMLKNYMTQNFTVVENQTEKKGVYVNVKDTIADVKSILNGTIDRLNPEDLMYISTLNDIKDKLTAQTLTKSDLQINNNTSNSQTEQDTSNPNTQSETEEITTTKTN